MLTLSSHVGVPARQKGVVLLIALIVLVAMTLAGIALVRSVDTTNLVAGNMAFQQSATQSGDVGVEAGITFLTVNNGVASPACASSALFCDDATNGYNAGGNVATRNPNANESWDAFWTRVQTPANTVILAADPNTGNQVSYVIDRLCASAGDPHAGANCSTSPVLGAAVGGDEEAGGTPINGTSQVYYRITTRISGPRNTLSYVQAIYAI